MNRYFVLTAILVSTTLRCLAQNEETQTGETYQLTAPANLTECVMTGAVAAPTNQQTAPSGSSFTIIGMDNNNYIISFWDWIVPQGETPTNLGDQAVYGIENNASLRNRLNYRQNNSNRIEHRYFALPKGSINGLANKLYQRFSPVIGGLTYAVKYRHQTGYFEKTLSLSATGGYSCLPVRTHPDNAIAFTVGIGVSSANVTKDNTSPSSGVIDARDESAITFSTNLIYIHKHLQIAASWGFDNLMDGNQIGWIYNRKGWFSFGVGANIFKLDNPSEKEGTNK